MGSDMSDMTRAPVFLRQILPPNSVAQFVKFRGNIIPKYIPQPVGVVVLTDNTSKYKEFIVTCDTKHITLGH